MQKCYCWVASGFAGWGRLRTLAVQERSCVGQRNLRARLRWTESPGRGEERQFPLCSEIYAKMQKCCCCGCVALSWLGRPLESSWPGELGRRLGDAQNSPTVDRALGEARKANSTLQRNLCENDVFSLLSSGLARQALGFLHALRSWAQARGTSL